eukprot:796655_1
MSSSAETSPLLATESKVEEKSNEKEIERRRNSIAQNIIDRCINSSTNKPFTKQEIVTAIISNNIPINTTQQTYDAASHIISTLASSNYPIIHNDDEDILSILTDKQTNGTTDGNIDTTVINNIPVTDDDDSDSDIESTDDSDHKHSKNKKKKHKKIDQNDNKHTT